MPGRLRTSCSQAMALRISPAVHGVANVAGGMVNIDREVYDIPLESFSLAAWRQMYALNIDSAFLMCRGLEKHFVAQRYGKVVNVASLAGQVGGMSTSVHYAASKAAVLAMTRAALEAVATLAKEQAARRAAAEAQKEQHALDDAVRGRAGP